MGFFAGQRTQGIQSVAIGTSAGQFTQGAASVAIGLESAQNTQGPNAVAIGRNSGKFSQGQGSVAVGLQAGSSFQGSSAVAIGPNAGFQTQGVDSVAIGVNSGQFNQASQAIALGNNAGNTSQKRDAIAIGISAGFNTQGTGAIAIGSGAGNINQGEYSIAIGYQAGTTNHPPNSILLKASAGVLIPPTNGFFVEPVRQAQATSNLLMYNQATREIWYSSATSAASKTFVIDHPDDTERYLVHGCLEGPEAGVYYRGTAEIHAGADSVVIRLPQYTNKLAREYTIHLTPRYSGSTAAVCYLASDVEEGAFSVYGPPGRFFWHVYGTRATIEVEPLKSAVEIKGHGPYKWISC
jgi:hypothetical protein